jgi:hypothetical protein
MRDPRRRRPLVPFIVCAAVLVVGGAEPYAAASRTSAESLNNDVQTRRSLAFSISGEASRLLAPGLASTIELVFHNPHPFPMSVTKVKVSVRSVTAPNADADHPCTYADFRILQSSRTFHVTIPANRIASLGQLQVPRGAWPAVAMVNSDTNQDGCKEATVALDFAGQGKRLR